MSKPDEELTFEEYWERYSCASDTPKQAARAAWILALKQEHRLQLLRNPAQQSVHPTPPTARSFSATCPKCGTFIGVDFAKSAATNANR